MYLHHDRNKAMGAEIYCEKSSMNRKYSATILMSNQTKKEQSKIFFKKGR